MGMEARTGVKHNAYAPPLHRGQAATAHDYVNPALPHVDLATGRHVTPPRETTPGRAISPSRPVSPTRGMKYGRPRPPKSEVEVRPRGRPPGSSKATMSATSTHFPYDPRCHKYPYASNRPISPSNGPSTSRSALKRPHKWVSEDSEEEQEPFVINGEREADKKVRKMEPGGASGSRVPTRRSRELPTEKVFQSMQRDLDRIVALYQQKQAIVQKVLEDQL
ncbi:hypothetical protein AAVH_17675 [Aphelenchoides avenae]|nr:hypothetical protein AAVH_17675 [Aphelenchus avenae]